MIGILDSGVGGLATFVALSQLYPTANLLYLADQAHLPYGSKSPDALLDYLTLALDWFALQSVEGVMLACGTLSSVALPRLRAKYSFPIYDIVSAGVQYALPHTKAHQAILLGTEATIKANQFCEALENAGFCHVYAQACPQFVHLVEQGICHASHPLLQKALELYLSMYRTCSADVLLLGCTHYHFLYDAIKAYLPTCHIVDCGTLLAHLCPPPKHEWGVCQFYTTGHLATFHLQLERQLGYTPTHIFHIAFD